MPSCDLTTRSDELAARAVALRAKRGYNCAQAVACALAPEIGADTEACYVLSEGFGGGMGGHTETCGAISGGVMALGQVSSGGAFWNHEEAHVRINPGACRALRRKKRLHHLLRAEGHRMRARTAP